MPVVQQPEARVSFTGDAEVVVQVGGSVHGDVTIGSARPRPNAVAARPYLLLETGAVVGRAELRRAVDEFLTGTGAAVLLLVGVPGIGKSALAWDSWKRRRASGARQFWYSFYDGRGVGSFAAMVPELARFLGLPETARVDAVLDAVAAEEVVLFLDGVERCLRCYQRPLGAVQDDGDELWHDTELGFASDDALRFFQQLTELPAGRVVATSRVVPADYFASGGALRAGITSHVVGPLTPADGRALLDRVGTPLTPADAATAASVLGGHPLALQLLARQVRGSVRPKRSLSAWLADEGYLTADGTGPRQLRDRLFVRAASALSAPACLLLAATGVLGGSADLPTLRAVGPAGLTDAEFRRAVREVVASGLAVADGDELGCHPLTGSAAAARLAPDETTALVRTLSTTLRGRFTGIDAWGAGYAGWYATADVSDRAEAMALCRALVRLGEWQAAAELYDEQLDLPLRLEIGANFEAVELLSALVAGLGAEQGEFGPDRLRPALAHHLLMIGRTEQAAHELAVLPDGAEQHDTAMVRVAVALHGGDPAAALEIGLAAVHGARRRLAAAARVDEVDVFGLPSARPLVRPSGDQVEALVRCAEVLLVAGRPAHAARLLVEALAVWRRAHDHCGGCRGLVLRAAAAVFAVCGDADAARTASTEGRALQLGQGRTMQGLFADVVVAARLPHLLPDLPAVLGGAGFLLYQQFALTGMPSLPEPPVRRAVGWLGPVVETEPTGLVELARAVETTPCDSPEQALEVDPCDQEARRELAARAVRAGALDEALEHLRWLIDLTEDGHAIAVGLVTGPGPFADGVRELLLGGAGALAAADAVIVLETRLGDDEAAERWRRVRRDLVRQMLRGF
ncbi:hypothetical protein ACVDFE_29315 [Lentzea chajnantorensis]